MFMLVIVVVSGVLRGGKGREILLSLGHILNLNHLCNSSKKNPNVLHLPHVV